jgi:hypothetical protein
MCILLIVFSIYFSPNLVINNLSQDGILEQITELRINYIRLAFSILSTIGLVIGALYIIKPSLLNLLQLKIFDKSSATLFLFKKRRSFGYSTWALVFTYMLFDDALQIHERFGFHFAKRFDFLPSFGLRVADIGEMAVSATAGISLLFLVAFAYLNGERAFKKVSQDMLLLILALVFFGVGADMALLAMNLGGVRGFILGVIEDGGEMLVASLILWYVFVLSTRDENSSSHICYFLRIFPAVKY